ncbi:DUF4880 domain-containing protein [Burkholderia cenocepacia]|jgi:ferric-dicitrate binding protein FerR (iron transport regulator)|uniref:DUF4880 domain-containing protein n=1 Tax=Burkholderia cenocepacia TaxID=95486 RepID=UPI003211BB4C
MQYIARTCRDPDFDAAWRLFTAMHDDPSTCTAKALVEWLAQCPAHVRAFDQVLTLWALAGGGLAKRSSPSILDEPALIQ